MLNRFLSLLHKTEPTDKEEREPLMDSEAVEQHPTDDFVHVPNEALSHIISYLKPEDMANFAKTNKRHRAVVNGTGTQIDVLAKDSDTGETTTRKATYAELTQILNQRKPLRRCIKKTQPHALVKYISDHEYVTSVVCTGGFLLFGGSSIAASFAVSSTANACSPTAVTLCFGGVGMLGASSAAQPVVRTVSEWRDRRQLQVDEMIEQLNAMPTVITMKK